MIKKILVTGCNGYLASNLINYLNNKKYKVNCISRDYDKEKIIYLIKNSNIIVHLAAITNPFHKNIFKVNVLYARFLVREAKKYNKKFIYISTQNVLFGKDNYSKTKKEAENIVKTLKNFIILRPTIIYGKNENKYIGKLIKIIKNYKLIPIIGDGKNKLQPIYIEDLIKIIEKCINKNIKGIFLVAGNSIINYNELVNLIINKLKLKRIKIYIPIFLIRPFAYLFQILLKNPPLTTIQLNNIKINQEYNINKINKLFNIKLTNIEEGLNKITKND